MKLGIVTPLKCARAWKSIATRAEKDTWMEERKIRLHFTPPPAPRPRKMREKTKWKLSIFTLPTTRHVFRLSLKQAKTFGSVILTLFMQRFQKN